ncbi:MAG: TIGR04190 family B12-binding domain/radical SAM domain protein [Chloroflexi bacterium]|nr:TIGR04190 family B12-binding domain/radical SAM domain protein [Chloroflexota bacterium]
MPKTDLILLHAPSNLDFREKPIIYGPISDVIPSTPIFEMYPIGFVSIASFLEKHGFETRIINVASRMLKDPGFDVSTFVQKLDAAAFGIDLHWLPHASGALDLARILKRHHPDTPVIFGGLSSTYFHQELIEYPFVDFVVRGDSTEPVVLKLVQRIQNGGPLAEIPNLTWKDRHGVPRFNALTNVPEDLNGINLDYSYPVRSVLKYKDLVGLLPFKNFTDYPITMSLSCRGCTMDCVTCGGSQFAYRNMCNRDKPAYRDPELIVTDIMSAQRFFDGPVFIIGDPFQAGDEYAARLLKALEKTKIRNPLVVEFFLPPPANFFSRLAQVAPGYNVQLSAESHDEEVRRAFGKGYSNKALEATIKSALDNGCRRFDLFFMNGLGKQNYNSVLDTARYSIHLINEFGKYGRLHPMMSPLAPFVDPGSKVYENPQKYGYKLFCNDLESHCRALNAPSWKYMLSYETDWMTRSEIVDSTYEAALMMNRAKEKSGLISHQQAHSIEAQCREALDLIYRVDRAVTEHGMDFPREKVVSIAAGAKHLHSSTLCPKKELQWPASSIVKSAPRILWSLLPWNRNGKHSEDRR